MSKAVLKLGKMPESCEECPLRLPDRDGGASVCYPMRQILLLRVGTDKPDWCPLRLMPEKESLKEICYSNFENGYKAGWNKAIKAIEGSGEDETTDGEK